MQSPPKHSAQCAFTVRFDLRRVMQARDMAKCSRRSPTTLDGSSPRLLSPSDVPLTSEPRNVTCLRIVAPNRPETFAAQNSWRTPCDKEFHLDDALRSELSLRFTHTITIPASEFARSGGSDALVSLRARVLPFRAATERLCARAHDRGIGSLQSPTLSALHAATRVGGGALHGVGARAEDQLRAQLYAVLALAWRRLSSSHADPQILTEYEQPALVAARALQVAEAAQQPGGPRADECALRGDELTAGGPAQRRARGTQCTHARRDRLWPPIALCLRRLRRDACLQQSDQLPRQP